MSKQAKLHALEKMAKEPVKNIPPHEVECPKCGHEWTMGEEEYEEDEEDEEEDED